jgi:hypothetical protein
MPEALASVAAMIATFALLTVLGFSLFVLSLAVRAHRPARLRHPDAVHPLPPTVRRPPPQSFS